MSCRILLSYFYFSCFIFRIFIYRILFHFFWYFILLFYLFIVFLLSCALFSYFYFFFYIFVVFCLSCFFYLLGLRPMPFGFKFQPKISPTPSPIPQRPTAYWSALCLLQMMNSLTLTLTELFKCTAPYALYPSLQTPAR